MNRRTLLQILALAASGALHAKPSASKLDETQQLKAMITAAVKTGQSSNSRGGNE